MPPPLAIGNDVINQLGVKVCVLVACDSMVNCAITYTNGIILLILNLYPVLIMNSANTRHLEQRGHVHPLTGVFVSSLLKCSPGVKTLTAR